MDLAPEIHRAAALAAMLVAVSACAPSATPGQTTVDSGMTAEDAGAPPAPDVAPPLEDAGAADAGQDAAPPVPDAGTPDRDRPGWTLVWSDEFDVDGPPRAADWSFERGFVRNEELQWYQPDNATCANGLLVIEARRDQRPNPNYQAGSSDWKRSRQYAEYTSASLNTSGLHSWQFGRFEMRGRIDTRAGLWPAWWTLGVRGAWPSNGEIDIMEFYQGKVLANVACGTATANTPKWDTVSKTISSFNDPMWSAKFHVWRMDWDDTKIDLYLDDALMNTSNLADMLNADGTSPFRQSAYMLLNLAIGGTSGGDPSGTMFPARFEIDYVRVFQKI
jgi:beta-glucanase (GH16 family)